MSHDRLATFRKRRAAEMRSAMTEAERKLWRGLQRLPLEGSHFRRQVVIGPYIADFACLTTRLIIEVDGSQHGEAEAIRYDADRTRYLNAEGFRLLRFWNADIMTSLESVLDTIHQAVFMGRDPDHRLVHERERHPTPGRSATRPSPSRGG